MRHLRSMVAGGSLALLAGMPSLHAEDSPPVQPPAGLSAGVSAKGPHHVYLVGDLLVSEPVIALDPQAPNQASATFTIENRGNAPDRLLTAESDFADKIVVDANGPTPGLGDGSLAIPAGQTVVLKPDGIHFLFQGLRRDIRSEADVPGILTFERAGPLPVQFATDSREASPDQPASADTAGSSLTK